MELHAVFETLNRRLEPFNTKNGFTMVKDSGVKADEITVFEEEGRHYLRYNGTYGSYKVILNEKNEILTLECSGDSNADAEYKEMSKTLLDVANAEERDIRSAVNELTDELVPLYQEAVRDIAAVKLPKRTSKSAIKNGMVSYTDVDLATCFIGQYGELKDYAKEIVLRYGELLPETFFMEYGTPLVMEALRSRDDVRLKKLFKLLNDVYENGTNAAQDLIAVTILGEIKNDPQLMETADQYMCEYMSTPVHEVNKLIGKKSLQKKLLAPPPYKPKKKKKSMVSSLMNGGQHQP